MTVNPPSLNVEICKLSTVKEFSSESTTIFLNYVADCASKKRQSSKIAYKAVHISYYMTAFKGLLSRTEDAMLGVDVGRWHSKRLMGPSLGAI